MLAKIFMLMFLGLQEVCEQYSAAAAGYWWTRYDQKFSLAPSLLPFPGQLLIHPLRR